MRRKIFKKAMAGMLVASMVLGMSMTAYATGSDPTESDESTEQTSGSVVGDGQFEGHVNKKVVKVTFPTVDATTFAYKMDPEGLIPETDNAKYSGASFEKNANVYFQSSTNTYTKDSVKLKVINKGTAAVDVTIKAEVAANDKITMVSDTTGFTDTNKAAQLYLGLKVANQAEKAVKATGASDGAAVVVGLKGKNDNFKITYDGTKYEYTAKTGVPDTAWNSFEFGLTGACNSYGDYSAEALAASDVTVTWSYAERASDSTAPELAENAVADAAPSIDDLEVTFSKTTGAEIEVNLGAGGLKATGIKAVAVVANGREYPWTIGKDFSFEESTLTFTTQATIASVAVGQTRTVKVTFDDTANTAKELTVTIAE